MCLGVARRGDLDEDDWFGERSEFWESYEDLDDEDILGTNETHDKDILGTNETERNATESGREDQEEDPPLPEKGGVKLSGEESTNDDSNGTESGREGVEEPPLSEKDGVDLEEEKSRKMMQEEDDEDNEDLDDGPPSLLYWLGKQLMATRCDNEDAVIEWVLVPFIIEEKEDGTATTNSTTAGNDANATSPDSTNSTSVGNNTNTTSTDDEEAGIDESSEDEEL
jgi:hypothetical protein